MGEPPIPIKDLHSPRGVTVEYQAEFFNNLPIGMARVTPDGHFELINDAFCRLLGYDRADLLATSARTLTHPLDRDASREYRIRAQACKPGQHAGAIEKRHFRKDGSILYGRMSLTPSFTANHELQYWLMQLIDIEETWHARRIQAAHSAVLDMLTSGDSMDAILNEVIARAEEADPRVRAVVMLLNPTGDHFEQVTAPSMPALFSESLTGFKVGLGRASCGTAVTLNERIVVHDTRTHSDWKDLQDLASAVEIRSCISQPVSDSEGKVLGIFTVVGKQVRKPSAYAITFVQGMGQLVGLAVERFRAIEALRLSRARFQTMVDHAPEVVLLVDCYSGRFIEANGRVSELYGVSPEQYVRVDPWTFAPELQPGGRSSRTVLLEHFSKARHGASPIFNFTVRTIEGQLKPCEIRMVRLPTQSGLFIRASVIDVTVHRRAELALRDSEENLRTIVNSIGDALIATDSAGCITHFNHVAEEITGVPRSEAVGQPVFEIAQLLRAEERTPLINSLEEVLREEVTLIRPEHALLISRDKAERYVSERATPIRSHDGKVKGMVLVLRDVTEWRETQEKALQSRKLEAIGQLAGGIAHDFNNLLTGIMGNAELLADHEDTGVRATAGMIAIAASRSADVTGQLLRFSRNEQIALAPINVHALIEEACKLMVHSLDKRIQIRLDLTAANATICGDATQLQNVFLNLMLNARDAIYAQGHQEGEGLITIQSYNTPAPTNAIAIRVSDNGVGIDPDVQEHIFEPFFSTKEVGSGTGLGLSSIYGTVKSLDGGVSVHSRPGDGASFCVTLPCVEEQRQEVPRAPKSTQPKQSEPGNGRILVVDDEDLVRNFVVRALTSFGYEVVGAEDGIVAEEIFREGQFDLVLLDLIMPRRGGLETYKALAALDPSVSVIVASGYSRDHTVDAVIDAGARDFLNKPFQLHELATKVKETLDARV